MLLVPHGFLLALAFYDLKVLGIGWGRRNVNGAWDEMNETLQVMKDPYEA